MNLIIHLAIVAAVCMTGAACYVITRAMSCHSAYQRGVRDGRRLGAAAVLAKTAGLDQGRLAEIPSIGDDPLPPAA